MRLRVEKLARAAALVVGLAVLAIVGLTLHRQYVQELVNAETRAANTARTLEQHAARTFEIIDTYLLAVASLVGPRASEASSEAVHAALREQVRRSRLNNIMVIDRSGRAIVEAEAFPARVLDVHDRDYFQVLRDQPQAGLVVGRPLTGRLTGKSLLPVARRIDDLDGAFAGIVQAMVDPRTFEAVYGAIDNGPGATLNLWREDGTLLVRSPPMPEVVGRNFADSGNYRAHVPSRDTRPFWSAALTDGVERVIAFGFLEGFPLYVAAAVSREDALADWRRSAVMQASVAGGLTLVLVAALLLLAREIERRRIVDGQVRASEEQYRLLAENTSDLIVFKPTMTGRRGYVSPAVRAILGWEPDEYAALPSTAIIHPDEMAEVVAVYAALSPEHPQATYVHRLRHKAGHYVWIESVFKLVGHDPRDRTVVVSGRDITGRREADAALRESEARLRLISENTSDTITRLGLDFRRTYASPSCRRLFGYTPEEMLGDQPSVSIHPDDATDVRAMASQLVAGQVIGDQTVTSYRARHKLGHWVWIEATLHLARDGAGTPDSIVCVLRDAGARKADEAALRAAREHAEIARNEAERASVAKGEFLAAMSHEIRTPLNGVIGYADLLCEEQGLGASARQHAERIRTAGAALLTVVNDVLDFSKVEAGRVELAPRQFALEAMIDNAASIVRASAERKSLSMMVERADGLPAWVEGDEDRLRQVLLNLLNNAVKFTDRGSVTLTVSVVPGLTDEAPRLRFAVRDTGIGVPEDRRDRLFQRFSQVDGSISRDYGGTGLGLAISKALVDLMGGAIGVDSVAGRGSTFWFEVDLPAAAASAVLAEPIAVNAAPGGGRRLLLAEDVPLNQDLARAILERAGHAVDVVGDGAAAVRAVRTGTYDLVLMDIQMAGTDGLTATRMIRALDGPAARVPIVAMTANVLPEQVAEFRAAGMDDHVGKPFRRDALLATIERWTAGASASSAPCRTVDRAVYDELQEMVGHERMVGLLMMLAHELAGRFGPSSGAHAPERIAGDAHAMVSAASMVGFTGLANLCREVEAACRSGADHAPLFEALRGRAAETIAEIEALRAA